MWQLCNKTTNVYEIYNVGIKNDMKVFWRPNTNMYGK